MGSASLAGPHGALSSGHHVREKVGGLERIRKLNVYLFFFYQRRGG